MTAKRPAPTTVQARNVRSIRHLLQHPNQQDCRLRTYCGSLRVITSGSSAEKLCVAFHGVSWREMQRLSWETVVMKERSTCFQSKPQDTYPRACGNIASGPWVNLLARTGLGEQNSRCAHSQPIRMNA